MNRFKMGVLVGLLLISLSVFASYAPANVKAALKKMYPSAQDVAWSQNNGYYIADFQQNGFDTKVWFTVKAKWVMRQIDWEVADELPPAVYNAYAMGEYSDWEVQDVTLVDFPNKPSVVVIEVGMSNVQEKYQLFYSLNGELLRTRDVTYMYDILNLNTFQ